MPQFNIIHLKLFGHQLNSLLWQNMYVRMYLTSAVKINALTHAINFFSLIR